MTVRMAPGEPPLSEVSAPSGVEFLRFQVRNMALEASAGGGSPGSDLDDVSAADGAAAISPLIAGWARTAGTPAAESALEMLGDIGATDPADLRIPMLVQALFLGDMVPGDSEATSSRPAGIRLAATNGEGAEFCDQAATYLSGVLEGILDPGLPMAPDWLDDAIDLYAGIESDPERLRRAVGAMALLVYATSISRPWVVLMSAAPLSVHYIVDESELADPSKSVRVSVDQGEGSFADEVRGCAALAGASLDEVELEGTSVAFVAPGIVKHGTDIEGDLELDENGTATLAYQTKGETREAHDEGTPRSEIVVVWAVLERRDIDELKSLVQGLLTGGDLGVAAPAVQAAYERLAPALEARLHPRGWQAVEVTWHQLPEEGAVWVTVDRPASDAVLAGRIIELLACDGAYGAWEGVFRLGGLDAGDGFTVPFVDVPVAFSFPGEGGTQVTSATVPGTVPTPIGPISVVYDLDLSTDGETLSITGTGSGDTGIVSVEESFGSTLSALPIEPAPKGMCP
ncbi:MAG: hypothetical protein M3452_05745 [Chloroflexota bacterium]|nr:hypothetical protein [Chloroflexota bacterium]